MRARSTPGSRLEGEATVPGDKSIAHRWLILAATGRGSSRLVDLPGSLDVRSMAACLAAMTRRARPALEAWVRNDGSSAERQGSTWNGAVDEAGVGALEVEGEGRNGLREPDRSLDCGNAGTVMRLLSGVLASTPHRAVLTGDASLSVRPMERVAEPLRAMGATISTVDGHAPVAIEGGRLRGITCRPPVPSAQVKGAVLLAGLEADGVTVVREAAATRDHTERALAALGAPLEIDATGVSVSRFQPDGFSGRCPGDPSSAAFLIAAAALTGSDLTISGVGLNPSRTHFVDVMGRMGIQVRTRIEREELGEPVGDIHVTSVGTIVPVRVTKEEVPLVIDEIPLLALVATHANGESRFEGAHELRLKEADRLTGVARGVRDLGGAAAVEGDDLVIGGGGLTGGLALADGDHRLAMAFTVGAFAASGPCEVDGIEAAEVSFPGFVLLLARLGAHLEATHP
jgi:3-phosphoshikimate 1-carboxyvinyltransferase